MAFIKKNDSGAELKLIIVNSKLTENQKDLWHKFIDTTIESDTITILKTIQEDNENLKFLTTNLEEKFKAIQSKNVDTWKGIVKKEKDYIESK